LRFKHIKIKNFLSFGNSFTEFNLDTNETTLIIGGNGVGKSALLEAIYFGYTGKPYRKITKPNLINNLNKKDTLIELTIENNGSIYIIRRGLKPNIFEIIKDGEPLNEDASIRDYQEQLEIILGVDYKTFKQTIMMSSRHYIPFLDLKPQEKREFIENIFSLKLFSDMNDYLKKKIYTTKALIKDKQKDIKKVLSNIKILKELNDKQSKQNKEQLTILKFDIKKLEENQINDKNKIKEKKEIIKEKKERIKTLQLKIKDKNFLEKRINILEYDIKKHLDKISFFQKNDVCKTCGQIIDSNFKEKTVIKHKKIKEEKNKKIDELIYQLDEFEKIHLLIKKLEKDILLINQKNLLLLSNIDNSNKQINEKKKLINKLTDSSLINQEDFERFNKELLLIKKEKNKLDLFQKYINITIDLISEKGIKKYIIKKYVPILNSLLNQYLKRFEASYSVMFNEELQEEIIARGYEDLTYDNLSSGEKQRLDTSLVFSFLKLCRLKNSVDTNVIFFDEILDASLDQSGINGILKIFEELKMQGYTVFVVSHRPGTEENFDKIFKFSKKRYTEIEEL